VPRPYASLHREVFLRVAIVVWALNFIHVPNVPIVGFDPLARLETVGKLVQKKIDVVTLTGGVGSADPHLIPREDVNPKLVPVRGLPRVFMGRKGVPPHRGILLRDLKVRPVDQHEAVIAVVLDETALKDDLLDGGGGQSGG
jgi:hypothetical protein